MESSLIYFADSFMSILLIYIRFCFFPHWHQIACSFFRRRPKRRYNFACLHNFPQSCIAVWNNFLLRPPLSTPSLLVAKLIL